MNPNVEISMHDFEQEAVSLISAGSEYWQGPTDSNRKESPLQKQLIDIFSIDWTKACRNKKIQRVMKYELCQAEQFHRAQQVFLGLREQGDKGKIWQGMRAAGLRLIEIEQF